MREIIRKVILKLFPELSGGLHLDRYARVLAVADEPKQGGSCEQFRPRYAVDLEILTPEGARDPAYPIYKDVPLPVASAGMERGVYGFPETGTLVVIGFAYGRPDHPLVKQIYPLGLSLPKVATGELLWQQDEDTLQRVDPNGNWVRKTTGQITDRSLKRAVEAVDSMVELVRDFRKVAGNSTEEIGGVKSVEALGALLFGSGGHIDMVAVDNLNFVTAADASWIVARNWNGVTGGNHHHTVMLDMTENVLQNRFGNTTLNLTETVGHNHSLTVQKDLTEAVILNRTETVGKDHTSTVNENRIETVLKDRTAKIDGNKAETVKLNFTRTVKQNFTSQTDGNYTESITGNQDSTVEGQSNETVTGDKIIEAENVRIEGTTITLINKTGTISFFPLMLDFMDEVRDALYVLDHHTHPEATKIVEGPEVKSHADDISVIRGKLDVLSG